MAGKLEQAQLNNNNFKDQNPGNHVNYKLKLN